MKQKNSIHREDINTSTECEPELHYRMLKPVDMVIETIAIIVLYVLKEWKHLRQS